MSVIKKVLVVDDEHIVRNLFQRMFGREYEVIIAENGGEARRLMTEHRFDLAFVDIVMPGPDGIETFREIKNAQPWAEVVIMTGFAVEDKIRAAAEMGAYECLFKPFTIRDVENIFTRIREAGRA